MKDIGKFIRKLESAYSDKSVVTYIDYAQKGETYYFDDNLTIPLLVADGKINVKHFRRHPKVDIELIRDVIGSSESPEHFNAKRKILNEKSVNINGTIIKGHSAEEEVRFPKTNNIVDVVLYDSKGEVLLGVEVCYKNKKSKEAINKLNKLNINIYEKNITDIKQSRFLCLYGGFCDRDNNNNGGSEFVSKKTNVSSIQQEIRELEEESRKDSKRIKEGREFLHTQQADINRLEKEIRFGVEGSQRRVERDIEFTEGKIKNVEEDIKYTESYIKDVEGRIAEVRAFTDKGDRREMYKRELKSYEDRNATLRATIKRTYDKYDKENREIQRKDKDIRAFELGISRLKGENRFIENK